MKRILPVLALSTVLTVTLSVAMTGCGGFRTEKNPTDSGSLLPGGAGGQNSRAQVIRGYNSLKAAIFGPKCIGCHGWLGDYHNAADAVSDIEFKVLVEKSMPKSGPLSESDQALVRAWIDNGAPEADLEIEVKASPAPSAAPSAEPSVIPSSSPVPTSAPSAEPTSVVTPTPSTTPSTVPSTVPSSIPTTVPSVTPTTIPSTIPSTVPTLTPVSFADVKAKVLGPSCVRCHTKNPRTGVDLNTWESARKALSDIEDRVFVMEDIPPRGGLSDAQKATLRSWINAGGPQ